MLTKFQELYKSMNPEIKEENEGAKKYHDKADAYEEMAQDEEKHSQMLQEMDKEIIEKPGPSIHSAKWDKCVEQVKASGKGKNAYAICTASLGSNTFKSMNDNEFGEKIKMYMQKLGIAGAGPIPESLLSRQDLEGSEEVQWAGEEAQKSQDIGNFAVWYYNKGGAKKCAVFGNSVDAIAYAKIVDVMGYKKIKILKAVLERTSKELDEVAEDAKEVEGKNETKSLVERIKNIQIKRQKATIAERDMNKSFKTKWSEINNNN